MSVPQQSEARQRAEKTAQAYRSARFLRLERLEQYAAGTQYKGRTSWWNDTVPLHERAPCIRAPIVERAVRGHVDLCLGETRFPRVTTHPSEDDSIFDDELGLSKQDSRVLDRFIQSVIEQAKLQSVSDDMMSSGLECGTAAAIVCARNAKLVVDTVPAKVCEPSFAANDEVVRLEIRYPYIAESAMPDGAYSYECLIYRRVIDEQRDVTYFPARASESGGEPDYWRENPDKTFEHNLGFCPVVWWRRARRSTTIVDIDGVAPHVNLLDEIDGLNFSLSQRHRAARYAGDPQICEYGVDADDDVKAPTGRAARSAYAGDGDHPANRSIILGPDSQPMRRKGPGSIWTYKNATSKAEYLTLPAGALESLSGDVKELFAMLRDAMGYVDLDPSNLRLGGDVSGRTLEWLYANAINFCNRLRPDFADGCFLALISQLLRLVVVLTRQGKLLRLPGLAKAAPIVARFEQPGEDGTSTWSPPSMRVVWGPYFRPTEVDNKSKQTRVLEAYEAQVITLQTAIEEIATLYPSIKDPAAYVEALLAERAVKQGSLHNAKARLDALGKDDEAEQAQGLARASKPNPTSTPEGETKTQPPARPLLQRPAPQTAAVPPRERAKRTIERRPRRQVTA